MTTIRIMGEDPPAILEWRDQIKAETRAGPSIWVWWPQFESNERDPEWGSEMASRGGKTWVHSPEEAERLVAEMAAMGVDGIKAHGVISSEIYRALLAVRNRADCRGSHQISQCSAYRFRTIKQAY